MANYKTADDWNDEPSSKESIEFTIVKEGKFFYKGTPNHINPAIQVHAIHEKIMGSYFGEYQTFSRWHNISRRPSGYWSHGVHTSKNELGVFSEGRGKTGLESILLVSLPFILENEGENDYKVEVIVMHEMMHGRSGEGIHPKMPLSERKTYNTLAKFYYFMSRKAVTQSERTRFMKMHNFARQLLKGYNKQPYEIVVKYLREETQTSLYNIEKQLFDAKGERKKRLLKKRDSLLKIIASLKKQKKNISNSKSGKNESNSNSTENHGEASESDSQGKDNSSNNKGKSNKKSSTGGE